MHIHPAFNPVMLQLGPLAIRWYAVSYLVGFALFMWLGRRRIRQGNSVFTTQTLDDFLTWGIIGVIVGGRLGYVLFYQHAYYFANPLEIFKVWQGGMSFHGGFLGVVTAGLLFAYKHKINPLKLADSIAPLTPLGFAAVRLGGNFVNGELWGRVTRPDAFWAMGFPQAHSEDLKLATKQPQLWGAIFQQYGMLPRHPSQLYQFALEGILLFMLLWWFSKNPRPAGQVASLFLLGFGLTLPYYLLVNHLFYHGKNKRIALISVLSTLVYLAALFATARIGIQWIPLAMIAGNAAILPILWMNVRDEAA